VQRSLPDPGEPRPAAFATTRWSLVDSLREAEPEVARAALAELCTLTWYPLYAFARRRGLAPEAARDRTQGFFADFLAREGFARAERERGRLRTFLLAAFEHFLANQAAAERAEKRGGGRTPLALDADEAADAERRYGAEPADPRSPERLYEAAWARGVLDGVLGSLRAEYAARGRPELFRALESELAGDSPSQMELAARAGMTAGAFKVAAHRLRARYRERLRAAIAATLADPAELEDELRALFDAVAGGAGAPPGDPGESA
jgi:DNA-directed RNA polymerase specialized sigma24 family protein